ncbi:MAG: hypothetical protein HQL69_19245 [Magnetococcales bacterium]|nr:hypothetical protein [Magnetococcales bacterium]
MIWDLELLFDLDGTIQEVGNGYWYKVEIKPVQRTPERPHGIDYSLTLHEPSGKRIYGIDNAHPIKASRSPGRKRAKACDHVHAGTRIRVYEYDSASALMQDFFDGVEQAMRAEGVWK